MLFSGITRVTHFFAIQFGLLFTLIFETSFKVTITLNVKRLDFHFLYTFYNLYSISYSFMFLTKPEISNYPCIAF